MMTTYKSLITRKLELLTWYFPLILFCLLALWLRTAYLTNDLPTNSSPDEPYYFQWAKAIRETGLPSVENGLGYPPALLYMLAGEQIIVEAVRGEKLIPAFDYFVVARVVSSIFGFASVVVSGLVGRQLGKSKVVGLVAALMATIWPVMVEAGRRGMANAPWLFFSLLTFICLYKGRDHRRIVWLYLALAAGILSFLFKYQTGVALILPFIYALLYFRGLKTRLAPHLIAWSGALLALTLWLVFYYQLFNLVNLPGNGAIKHITADGKLVGLQSWEINIRIIAGVVAGNWYLWGAGIATGIALYTLITKKWNELIDGGLALSFAGFILMFYLLMSVAPPFPHEIYWIPLTSAFYLLGVAGMAAILRIVSHIVAKAADAKWSRITEIVSLATLVAFNAPFIYTRGQELIWIYEHAWSKPYTVKLLDEWFDQHVPQGGRVVSERIKMPDWYIYAPPLFHRYVADSIFAESVGSYRSRGYEYLIWNSMTSNPTDSLADLDAESNKAYLDDVKEVLRLTGENVAGMDIVVYQLPPLQEHPLYFWFGDRISFRGFDLNRETLKPGDELQLTLYWMSVMQTPANYIVFVHVLAADGKTLLVGQDGPPDNGNRPTWSWRGDMDFVTDQHALAIPPDAPAGFYSLKVGLYDADTQQRLQISEPTLQPVGDTVTLAEIRIQKQAP
ncbi:MAG: glycosyltransferase family 39 protein [Chloroflexi bacterium]|nr:glycosyltransferase family 39 protein [Chloroflexota bacterium]